MANFIKIPLAVNPPRSFAAAANLTSAITTNSTDATNQVAAPTAYTTSGSGTGAVISVTIAGNAVTWVTVGAVGEGYKVGDTLTFSTTVIGGTTDVVITLEVAHLIVVEGAALNTYYPIDVDQIAFIDINTATTCDIVSNNWDLTAGAPLIWTATMDDSPVTTAPHLCADISDAVNSASKADNSIPTVDFRSDAEVISVNLV